MALQSREAYVYAPLSGPDCTRVLRVLKAKNRDDPLECELFERSLTKRFPTYEAVSYTWGGQKRDHFIYVGGKYLTITKNCADLLRNFRNPRKRDANSKRRLWVDSICINQNDDDEKCIQVDMMQQIYQSSSQVLIWLGEPTRESDLLFQTIRKSTWQWWNPWKSKSKMDFKLWQIETALEQHPEWILDLAAREWFTRVWTIQEAASGMFGVLRCGEEKLLIGTFFTWYRRAFNGVSEVYHNIAVLLEHIQRFALHFRVRIGTRNSALDYIPYGFYEDFSVTELLRDVRLCGAFNPKDKIFALHGVFRRMGIELPLVDYTRSKNEIYYTTTLRCLQRISQDAGSLQLIALVSGRLPDESDPHPLPSWVPDYSDEVPPYSVFDHNGNVHRNIMKSNFKLSPDNLRLCTPAIVVDRVDIASRLITWHPNRVLLAGDDIMAETLKQPDRARQTIAALQDWYDSISNFPENYEHSSQSKQEAFLATIGAHRGATNIHAQAGRIKSLKRLQPTEARIKTLLRELMTSQAVDSRRVAEILPHLHQHTFESDAIIWCQILMANDAAYSGLNSKALSILLGPQATTDSAEDVSIRILRTLHSVFPGLCESVITACRGNTFFRTTAGYMGAGTSNLADGDLIVFIGGLVCPMAVRRVGGGHRLLGPVHVHGIMEGELWPKVGHIYQNKIKLAISDTGWTLQYYRDLELV